MESAEQPSLLACVLRAQAELERVRLQLAGGESAPLGSQANLETEIARHQSGLELQRHSQQEEGRYFARICLTGGPCAGKTTGITHLTERLRERGYQVFVVPEAATLIFGAGAAINLVAYSDPMKVKFQYHLMQLQMMLEDIFYGIASTTGAAKIVLLCDRGVMDGSAYLGPELWAQMLYDYDLNESTLRDRRYDQVVHLSTAADGAEGFYSAGGNAARSESLEEARELDGKLVQAWMQHPHYTLIHNRPFRDFAEKLEGLLLSVCKFLGEPLAPTFHSKFIVANPRGELAGLLEAEGELRPTTFQIEDHIFFAEGGLELKYYRKRKQEESTLFTLCRKVFAEGQLIENKRLISSKEFAAVANLQLPNKHVLRKHRAAFTHRGCFMLLDTMTLEGLTLSVLTVQGSKQGDPPEIPELIRRNIAWEANNGPVELLAELLVRNKASIIGDRRDRLESFVPRVID